MGVLVLLFCLSNITSAQADEVNRLINQLKSEDWRVRYEAVKALGEIGDSRAVEPLISALKKDRDSDVRWRAAEALGKIGDSRAVEPLIAALEDRHPFVRSYAAEALGKIGDSRAVESLISALKDKKWGVRYSAAEALGKIGDPRAVKALITALKDKDGCVREKAAEALSKIGKPAVKPLVSALKKDRDSDVRWRAAEALGKIGDPRAVRTLITALKDKDGCVREKAAEALSKIGKPAVKPLVSALKSKDYNVRRKAADALDKLGWKAKNKREKALYLTVKEREIRPKVSKRRQFYVFSRARGYFLDRGRDAADILTAGIGMGLGAKARAGPVQSGLLLDIPMLALRGGGLWANEGSIFELAASDIQLLVWGEEEFECAYGRQKDFEAEGLFILIHVTDKPRPYYYTQLEVVGGLLATIRLGFNPGELLDFVLGWTTIDIFSDDLKRGKKK